MHTCVGASCRGGGVCAASDPTSPLAPAHPQVPDVASKLHHVAHAWLVRLQQHLLEHTEGVNAHKRALHMQRLMRCKEREGCVEGRRQRYRGRGLGEAGGKEGVGHADISDDVGADAGALLVDRAMQRKQT